jgi:DNA-directed RNA polymerase specialized sigma24 family protein
MAMPVPDPVVPVVLMSLDAKRRFLAARRTARGIRRVARSRGVLAQDREDVVQQTCAAAWRARLPADPEGARRVVNRIAFAVACTFMRRHPASGATTDETGGEDAFVAPTVDPAYEVAVREQVQRLLDEGRARFPNRLDAFVASAVDGVTAKEEALRRGVTESHVRKERSEIRTFLAEHGQKIGVLFAAALVLLVLGSMTDWRRQLHATVTDDGSIWTPRVHQAPRPAADAGSLRARAAESFRQRDFQDCLDELDAARALDGLEDTVEEAEMRARAEQVLHGDRPEGRKPDRRKPDGRKQ